MTSNPRWPANHDEPDLASMMADPIVHLVMRRDGIQSQDVWNAVALARSALTRAMVRAATGVTTDKRSAVHTKIDTAA